MILLTIGPHPIGQKVSNHGYISIGHHQFNLIGTHRIYGKAAEEAKRKAINEATELQGELVVDCLSTNLMLKGTKDAYLKLLHIINNINVTRWDQLQEWRWAKTSEIRGNYDKDFNKIERDLQEEYDQESADLEEKYKKKSANLEEKHK